MSLVFDFFEFHSSLILDYSRLRAKTIA